MPKGEHLAARTHCPRGHAYTPENTVLRKLGKYRVRACRLCINARRRARLMDPEARARENARRAAWKARRK